MIETITTLSCSKCNSKLTRNLDSKPTLEAAKELGWVIDKKLVCSDCSKPSKSQAALLKRRIKELQQRKIVHKLSWFTIEVVWVWDEDIYVSPKSYEILEYSNTTIAKLLKHRPGLLTDLVDLLLDEGSVPYGKFLNKELKIYLQQIKNCCEKDFTQEDWNAYYREEL